MPYVPPRFPSFSERLRALRGRAGITQAQLGSVLGISQYTISAYENGREPDFATLIKIAEFFDVSVDWLVGKHSDAMASIEQDTYEFKRLQHAIEALSSDLSLEVNPLIKDLIQELINYIESGCIEFFGYEPLRIIKNALNFTNLARSVEEHVASTGEAITPELTILQAKLAFIALNELEEWQSILKSRVMPSLSADEELNSRLADAVTSPKSATTANN